MRAALQLQTNQLDCITAKHRMPEMNGETGTWTEITMGSRHTQ